MRRLALVAAALVVPAVPMIAAAPAFAADSIICVNPVLAAGPTCTQSFPTIPQASNAASMTPVADVILIDPGTYTGSASFQFTGNGHALTVRGAGQGSNPIADTVLTLPAAGPNPQNYVVANQTTLQNLRILMTGGANSNDFGLALTGGSADHVTIDGTGTLNSTGIRLTGGTVSSSSILMPNSPASGTKAVLAEGGNLVTDSILTGTQGAVNSSGGQAADTFSRVTIQASYRGIVNDGGTLNIDDALVDMGSSGGTGIASENFNASTTVKAVNAEHVTVVGSGAGSRGIAAYAGDIGAKQSATVTLTNSIIRGPETSLVAEAKNNGAQGGPSNATINVSHSSYQVATNLLGSNGAGGVVAGAGNLPLGTDPKFVNPAADYHLAVGSPAVDTGNPAAGGPALDRDGAARVTDGDGNGTSRRDMGAFERPTLVLPPIALDKTAPDTTITSKVAKRSPKKKVKITFTSEAGATFQCQLDGGAWKACSSPYKVKVKLGKHTVLVRAIDKAGNVDATPAKAKFKRIKKPS